MLAIYKSSEPVLQHNIPQFSEYLNSIKTIFLQKRSLILIGFIFCFKMGEIFTANTSGIIMPFLIQGKGFTLDNIAYINNILGIIALIIGGLLSGVLIRKWSLYCVLWVFGSLQVVTNLLFYLLAVSDTQLWFFALAVVSDNLVVGMSFTALVVLCTQEVNRQITATHYSFFIIIAALPRVISGPLGALLYNKYGWVSVYQYAIIFALSFIPWLIVLKSVDNCHTSCTGSTSSSFSKLP